MRARDRWCAIAIETDDEWQSLCRVIGQENLVADYPDNEARLRGHDEIDQIIKAWTQSFDAYELMRRLQAERVPAGVVQRSSDLLEDPQLVHRGFYRYLEHPIMGRIPYAGHQ